MKAPIYFINSNFIKLAPALTIVYIIVMIFFVLRPFNFTFPHLYVVFSFAFSADGGIHFFKNWTKRDFFNNIVLYLPFGFLVFAALKNSVRYSGSAVLKTSAMAGVLSATLESLQIFLPSRESAISDLIANGLGGTIGAYMCCCYFFLTVNLLPSRKSTS